MARRCPALAPAAGHGAAYNKQHATTTRTGKAQPAAGTRWRSTIPDFRCSNGPALSCGVKAACNEHHTTRSIRLTYTMRPPQRFRTARSVMHTAHRGLRASTHGILDTTSRGNAVLLLRRMGYATSRGDSGRAHLHVAATVAAVPRQLHGQVRECPAVAEAAARYPLHAARHVARGISAAGRCMLRAARALQAMPSPKLQRRVHARSTLRDRCCRSAWVPRAPQ